MPADGVVTVGVFTHNHARFVAECVGSIMDDRDLRVVIVDDASSDDTPDRLREAADALKAAGHDVDLRLDTVNRGFVARLNDFLDTVDTEFFCLLSGDDRFVPGGVSILRDAATAQPSAAVVFGDYRRIDADSAVLPDPPEMQAAFARRLAYEGTPAYGFADMLSYGSFVPGGNTLVRTAFVRERGARFDTRLRNAEDYAFWLSLGPQCAYLFVDEHVWDYRVLPTSKYHAAGNGRRLRAELLAIGSHRSGVPFGPRVRSVVQAAHRAKRQWLARGEADRVSVAEAARLVRTPRWAMGTAAVIAYTQSAFARMRRR